MIMIMIMMMGKIDDFGVFRNGPEESHTMYVKSEDYLFFMN